METVWPSTTLYRRVRTCANGSVRAVDFRSSAFTERPDSLRRFARAHLQIQKLPQELVRATGWRFESSLPHQDNMWLNSRFDHRTRCGIVGTYRDSHGSSTNYSTLGDKARLIWRCFFSGSRLADRLSWNDERHILAPQSEDNFDVGLIPVRGSIAS
jgi:hypothetical protein